MSCCGVWNNAADVRQVRCWHETDMLTSLRNVRYQSNSGKHLLALSFSGFDPELNSRPGRPFFEAYGRNLTTQCLCSPAG